MTVSPQLPALADFQPGIKRLEDTHQTVVKIFWIFGLRITLAPGLYTDGASIPPIFQPLVGSPWDMPRLLAAIVHDALYGAHWAFRWLCDRIYLLIRLQNHPADKRLCYLEYVAIRLGGREAWRSKTSSTLAYTRERLSVRLCLVPGRSTVARLAILLGLCLCAGCASKIRNLDMAGMYASEAGTLAIGKVEVMAAPQNVESAHIRYKEDTAWLSPATKTHEVKILITGTNAVDKVDGIVKNICEAFKVAAAPQSSEIREPENQK